MKIIKLILIISLVVPTGSVFANEQKPSFSATQTENITAQVQSINYTTREVTLLDSSGAELNFIADENVRNLDELVVGDILFAEHTETVSVDVYPGNGVGPDQSELLVTTRQEEGEKPGGKRVGSVSTVSVVNSINLDNNTFTLEESDGRIQEYRAMNPANLRLAEVGDIVVVTITESLTIVVETVE